MGYMQKEYGKLTPAQFRTFVDQLPAFQTMAEELRELTQHTSNEKWDTLFTHDYSWAWVYELPYPVHVAIAIYVLNLSSWANDVAASPDPQQRVLDDFGADTSPDFHPDVERQHGIGIVVSLVRTMQSIAMHGRSLSALIQDVRDENDMDSLFKAIKVDRSIVNCSTIADCIAKAEMCDDKAFFRRLGNAFNSLLKYLG